MEGKVSDWDREYMKRLGRYIAEANGEDLAEHLEQSGAERIAHSERLSERSKGYANVLRDDDDSPAPLYDRARKLGLIKKP